jgi:hypothetical protein
MRPPLFLGWLQPGGTPRAVPGSMIMQQLSPEQVLVKCSQCGAWPMSLAPDEGWAAVGRLTFRCSRCRALEVYTVGFGGQLIPARATR